MQAEQQQHQGPCTGSVPVNSSFAKPPPDSQHAPAASTRPEGQAGVGSSGGEAAQSCWLRGLGCGQAPSARRWPVEDTQVMSRVVAPR